MIRINFKPFPNLITHRLVLRQLKIEDANEIFALRSDERVNKFLDRPKAITNDDAEEFIHKINNGITKNEWIYWAITLKNTDKLIGTICYWNISKEHSKGEIGYELLPDYQGKGIMQEALAIIIEYGFEKMKFYSIEAVMSPENSKSIKLLEKNGFIKESNIRENNSNDRKISDTLVYTLINNKNIK